MNPNVRELTLWFTLDELIVTEERVAVARKYVREDFYREMLESLKTKPADPVAVVVNASSN